VGRWARSTFGHFHFDGQAVLETHAHPVAIRILLAPFARFLLAIGADASEQSAALLGREPAILDDPASTHDNWCEP